MSWRTLPFGPCPKIRLKHTSKNIQHFSLMVNKELGFESGCNGRMIHTVTCSRNEFFSEMKYFID